MNLTPKEYAEAYIEIMREYQQALENLNKLYQAKIKKLGQER